MDSMTIITIAIEEAFNQAFDEASRSGVAMCAQRIASELKGYDPTFDDKAFLSRALVVTAHS